MNRRCGAGVDWGLCTCIGVGGLALKGVLCIGEGGLVQE